VHLEIILTGLMALAVWGLVWRRSLQGPWSWCSPTALFAAGVLLFYIIPSLYWQFRPWDYPIPPYFEGVPLVLAGALVLGVPFLYGVLTPRPGKPRLKPWPARSQARTFNSLAWVFLVPILLGVGWRLHTIQLGWQSRLEREIPTLLGSTSLALIASNFSYYYPLCYFALVAFGNRPQRRVGQALWVADGFFMLFTLHRFEILIYLFRSAVFLTLLGWKFRRWQKVAGAALVVFVLAILGQAGRYAYERVEVGRLFLEPLEVVEVITEATRGFFTPGIETQEVRSLSLAENRVLRVVDYAMYRLYEARSASAVMINVPKEIPYFGGETFTQVLYSFIPRYFWKDKPELWHIHAVTIWVMPYDIGVNPAGTIAELYMNYGFLAVFLGGIACWWLCRPWEGTLRRKEDWGPALICLYPWFAELFFVANENLTRRLCEGLRGLMVLALVGLVMRLALPARRAPRARVFPAGDPAPPAPGPGETALEST
jgi:hypothetical protein